MQNYEATDLQRHAYVVDDDDGFRESLALLLTSSQWTVSTFESIALFRSAHSRLAPGVLVLDIRMPLISGLDFIERPDVSLDNFAIIMVTGHGEVNSAVRSLKAGAIDFIEKPFCGRNFLKLLNKSYGELLDRIDRLLQQSQAADRLTSLSTRERQVLSGLMVGSPYKVVAHELGISVRTVEMYRNNLIRKLGVRTTTEATQIGALARLRP